MLHETFLDVDSILMHAPNTNQLLAAETHEAEQQRTSVARQVVKSPSPDRVQSSALALMSMVLGHRPGWPVERAPAPVATSSSCRWRWLSEPRD